MLTELRIRDFAIIDRLRIDFTPGLNVLTGETGAGKSIILDAMALVLGERADTSMVREGSQQAYVEATFGLTASLRQAIYPLLEAEGLENDDENSLLLARELRLNGRNICRVNGRAVNLGLLRAIGDRLVDIHGQGEHLSLLRPKSHLPLLDAYAGLEGERRQVGKAFSALRSVQRELRELREAERSLAQRADMLSFQVKEIDAANLSVGEEEELREERTRLANAERLSELGNTALAHLIGLDDERQSAIDLLGEAERAISGLAAVDVTASSRLEGLQGLAFQLSELAAELRDYVETLEFNPGRLDHVEERLELLGQLKRKYGNDIDTVLMWRDKAAAELEEIERSDQRLQDLTLAEEQQLIKVGELAFTLSGKRQRAAEALAIALERELAELYMEQARFQVGITRSEIDNGVPVDGRRYSYDETGIDQVEFLVSANPGEPLRPLAKVASGGETSRLMLALKTVLAQADITPTLIFDEIDQGIGGRVGNVVGRKLWDLTHADRHQVIVVTHLPQLAGYADRHFHVSKDLSDGRTLTSVASLDQNGRVQELAAMLGTMGEHAKGGAESILQQVASAKSLV